jgi:hypothetical protein
MGAMESMSIGTIFGRLLVAGAMATAVLALAATSGILPTSVTQRHGSEHRDRGHRAPDGAEMKEIVELLRREGFSEPYSLEREHGMIEAKATGRDGRRYEIYIDPKTRKILERERDD